ncbi:iron ABC transporter permease [Lentisphaera profundi]|uniref:Iron ABC transporter permease n=1 Tax=Lentisphaera profundi TaxID=1658616 RepID=A0ABY7VT37_9BACT|nr:iron ABC transporter permease [Lentisphaera profundi]WDE97217.1 iron ABC transporter permease [Lentisphaera profundi]
MKNSLPCILSLIALIFCPLYGFSEIDIENIFNPQHQQYFIFWELRMPRIILCWICGAGLAIGGMAFQALFRNELASPFTLGISGGAALGVAILTMVEIQIINEYSSIIYSLAAFLGCLIAISFILLLHRLRPNSPISDLLLGGVALSFIFNSLILFIQYMARPDDIARMVYWMMGSMQIVGYKPLLYISPLILPAILIIYSLRKELDLLFSCEQLAATRGVQIRKNQRLIFLAVSLMSAGLVSLCGPIGFVGLVVPHICRRIYGPGHKTLFWQSLFFGAFFLCFCDLLCRVLPSQGELPIGIMTALIGTPFFIYIIFKKR